MMSFENEATLISLANGNPWISWSGILVTAPLIFFGSHLISSLLKKYDFIIYIGAAILFKISLDLVFKTAFLSQYASTGSWVLEGLFVIYVINSYLSEKGITLFRVKLH